MRAPTLLGVLLACSTAAAAPAKSAAPPSEPYDVSAIKEKLAVLSDGKQHYVVLVMSPDTDLPIFYGDGKTFYQMRIFGGGSEGTEGSLKHYNRVYWDPRVNGASVDLSEGKWQVSCGERKTALTRVLAAEAQPLVAAAKFFKPRWNRRAYALARDRTGRYFYVDKQREPEDSKNFRLWAGLKGAMKPQKMVNVVSDSEGDIFATRSGQLRLVLDKHETTWVQNKAKTPLVFLPVEDNHVLIYSDLGVYTGEPLGTPCDDL